MKKTKKLAALFLALMMALSCMAMPAMAAGEDDGIMPRWAVKRCPDCDEDCDVIERNGYDVISEIVVAPCRYNVKGMTCRHYTHRFYTDIICTKCTFRTYSSIDREYCGTTHNYLS